MGTIKVRLVGDGSKVYDAEVRRKGFARVLQTFGRHADAAAWIQGIKTKMRQGRYAGRRFFYLKLRLLRARTGMHRALSKAGKKRRREEESESG
jgi:hypothetical protein